MSILNRKKPNADLRNYYNLYLQFGLIVALLVFLIAFNVHFQPKGGIRNRSLNPNRKR